MGHGIDSPVKRHRVVFNAFCHLRFCNSSLPPDRTMDHGGMKRSRSQLQSTFS
jgi:hypothetical protein